MRWLVLIIALSACKAIPNGKPGTKPALYYLDSDGDGLGETSATYFGCDPPQGYVATATSEADTDTDADADADTDSDTDTDTG